MLPHCDDVLTDVTIALPILSWFIGNFLNKLR